jgi:hypothetical protein
VRADKIEKKGAGLLDAGRKWTSQLESAGIKSEITSQQQVEAAERSDLFVVTDAF